VIVDGSVVEVGVEFAYGVLVVGVHEYLVVEVYDGLVGVVVVVVFELLVVECVDVELVDFMCFIGGCLMMGLVYCRYGCLCFVYCGDVFECGV